jgi:hypothetical protein
MHPPLFRGIHTQELILRAEEREREERDTFSKKGREEMNFFSFSLYE